MLAACQPGGTATADPTAAATAAGGGTSAECGGSADTPDGALKVVTGPIGCPGGANTFWSQKLGSGWTVPRFLEYHDGEIPQDECGAQSRDPDDFASNAFYCSLDDTVAYSAEFMAELSKQDTAYPMLVLMHELGHRASALTNRVGVVSRSEENQADCLAGAEAKFTQDAGRLPLGDVGKGALLFFSLGDDGGNWFASEANTQEGAHGNPTQRTAAFSTGYFRGLDHCFDIGKSADGGLSLIDSLFG
ncbi:neutral zinc metallopeptidase [Pseudofrankia sp. BMG5.37]|nr:neutral zinc metallopeptidase [Pseudofrankia sp. BMG5.36]MDT3446010.1 neutral zinc metallopeptidase [Pseudofrankia sp. BMG5.37]OHV58776.1 metalloprotease [Pseudofrankia sp. BMG5.36]